MELFSLIFATIFHPTIVTSFGLISAVFVTLGFFPPHAYIARIHANAVAGSH